MKNNLLILLSILIFLNACKIADISQPGNLHAENSEQIANEKLDEVLEAQGFEVFKEKNLYQARVTDDWKGFVGKIAKLWPDANTQFQFRFNFNTFDGNADVLSGEKKGDLMGVQGWQYYEKSNGSEDAFEAEAKTREFGIVVLHYLIELPYRLRNAPFKRYYGKQELRGKPYDLVFVSWGSEAASADYDQYIVWINQESHLVDYIVYTLRDNTNPLTRHKYGSMAYLDYREIEGFKVATRMPVLIDDGIITTDDLTDYFHQFTIEDFEFGGFEEAELYPLPALEKKLDSK
ncbi:MAG: hypothetical protein AAFR87_03230 [Bacteroidota bacterium]